VKRRTVTCSFCGQAGPHRGYSWCGRCYERWRYHGRPASGPPAPGKTSDRGNHAALEAAERREDYAWLRAEQGLTRRQAAERLGVTIRTAERYDAQLRAAS
jgi:hypothetical protein